MYQYKVEYPILPEKDVLEKNFGETSRRIKDGKKRRNFQPFFENFIVFYCSVFNTEIKLYCFTYIRRI